MNFNRMDTAHRLRVDAKLFGGNANIVNSIETELEPVSPASTTSRSPSFTTKQAYCLFVFHILIFRPYQQHLSSLVYTYVFNFN